MNLVGIIPTLERPEDIVRLFDSINQIRPVPDCNFSIILVDNSSSGSLAEFSETLKCNYPVVYINETQKGLSHARNAAIKVLDKNVDYVCTIDDDLILPESYFEDIVKVVKAHPEFGVIGGRVELFNDQDLPITIKTSTVEDQFDGNSLPFGFLHGCCMLLSKQDIDHTGFFDTNLGAGTACGSAEDTDYYYRIWKNNKDIIYSPEWFVFHNHGRRTAEEKANLKKNYNLGQGAFFFKHISNGSKQILKQLYWDFRSDFIGLIFKRNLLNENKNFSSILSKWKFRLSGIYRYYKQAKLNKK